MLAEFLDAKPAPVGLLPLDVSVRWPHLTLFTDKFCNAERLAAMREFAADLSLGMHWAVSQGRVDGVDYRIFAFDNAYQANLFAVAYDAAQFDSGDHPALRLEC